MQGVNFDEQLWQVLELLVVSFSNESTWLPSVPQPPLQQQFVALTAPQPAIYWQAAVQCRHTQFTLIAAEIQSLLWECNLM